jgi:Cof subfamily protein (haloacid dehalogenase superfamily)
LIKLVLSDMDNTLIPIGHAHVSARTLVAIRALQAEGIEFGPSTGRGPVELLPFFVGDDRYFATGVLYNGKKVYVDGECVAAHYFDYDALVRLNEIVAAAPDSYVCCYPEKTDQTNPAYCLGMPPQKQDAFGKRYRFRPLPAREVPKMRHIGVTIASQAPQEVVDGIRAEAARQIPELDIVQTFPGWCDVLPAGVNKATGLQELLDQLGIARDEVVAFGDAENDLAILNAVENSVAVANATPEVKRVARWHVGACADDGVAIAMEQIAQAAHAGGVPEFMK